VDDPRVIDHRIHTRRSRRRSGWPLPCGGLLSPSGASSIGRSISGSSGSRVVPVARLKRCCRLAGTSGSRKVKYALVVAPAADEPIAVSESGTE